MPEHLSIPMDTFLSSVPTDGTKRHRQQEGLLNRTPTPIYRHAAPSGPWPWMDFDEDIPSIHPPISRPTKSDITRDWEGYPQRSFPNWTQSQVKRCKMLAECPVGESSILKVDMLRTGNVAVADPITIKDKQSRDAFWKWLQSPREDTIRVRVFFVKSMSKEVLQMLGTRYIIEPFFFSSSTNWIPSRYQENARPKQDDHITVVLPFIRAVSGSTVDSATLHIQPMSLEAHQAIDTQAPLYLGSCNKYILQDLVSVHMIRAVKSSTIISYHPEFRGKTADQLYSLINRTGRSVYWSKIFSKSKDPTCLFLCFLWYAMYEWDEVFEILHAHINRLEQSVLDSGNLRETQELYILQARLLYYRILLEDFRKSVQFVQKTENPAMHDPSVTDEERDQSKTILKRETEYLISETERLESQRLMQVMRLKNIIDLAFAAVNIDDSRYMKDLTAVTVRDSAAMKQMAYLTMIFLPANFMSNIFSMNVKEINPSGGETLVHYVEGAVSLSIFAAWLAITLQAESVFFPKGSSIWRRVGWPVFYVWGDLFRRKELGDEKPKT